MSDDIEWQDWRDAAMFPGCRLRDGRAGDVIVEVSVDDTHAQAQVVVCRQGGGEASAWGIAPERVDQAVAALLALVRP